MNECWNYRRAAHHSVTLGHWFKHIRVWHFVQNGRTLECDTLFKNNVTVGSDSSNTVENPSKSTIDKQYNNPFRDSRTGTDRFGDTQTTEKQKISIYHFCVLDEYVNTNWSWSGMEIFRFSVVCVSPDRSVTFRRSLNGFLTVFDEFEPLCFQFKNFWKIKCHTEMCCPLYGSV